MKKLISLIAILITCSPASQAYIGGDNSAGQIPVVGVYSRGSTCTGAKIGPGLVLLAGHCNMTGKFSPGNLVNISDFTGHVAPGHSVSTNVVAFTSHPTWDDHMARIDMTQYFDLAVLQVKDPLDFLPLTTIDTGVVDQGNEVISGGMGCKGEQYPRYSQYTYGIKKVLANREGNHFKDFITLGLMDSYGDNSLSFACKGDSGGPLFRFKDDRLVVVGVNSAIPASLEITVDKESGEILKYVKIRREAGSGGLIRVDIDQADMIFYVTRLSHQSVINWLKNWIDID